MKTAAILFTALSFIFGSFSPALAELIVNQSVNQPPASTRVYPSFGSSMTPVLNLDIVSKDEAAEITSIELLVNLTNQVRAIYVMEGNVLLYRDMSPTLPWVTLNMSAEPILIGEGRTKNLTIKVDLNPEAVEDGVMGVTLTDINYRRPNGDIVSSNAFTTGPEVHLFSAYAEWTPRVQPAISLVQTNQTTAVATFNLRLNAVGGNVVSPKDSDFTVMFKDIESGTTYFSKNIFVATTPANIPYVPEGAYVDVTVTATLPHADFNPASMVLAKITRIKWAMTGNDAPVIQQNWGLEKMVSNPSNTFFEEDRKLTAIKGFDADNGFILIFRSPPGDLVFQQSEDLVHWHNTGWFFLDIIQEMPDGTRLYVAGLFKPDKEKVFFRVGQR